MILIGRQSRRSLCLRWIFTVLLAADLCWQFLDLQLFCFVFKGNEMFVLLFRHRNRLLLVIRFLLVNFRFDLLPAIVFIKAWSDRLLRRTNILIFCLFYLVGHRHLLHFGKPEVLFKGHALVVEAAGLIGFLFAGLAGGRVDDLLFIPGLNARYSFSNFMVRAWCITYNFIIQARKEINFDMNLNKWISRKININDQLQFFDQTTSNSDLLISLDF